MSFYYDRILLSNVMMFTKRKFSLEKWHEDEFDEGQNDVKQSIIV